MTTKLSEKDIRKILLRDPHVITIEEDPEWITPVVNPSLWKQEIREKAKRCIEDWKSFLNLPYIPDKFVDYEQRHQWRLKLQNDYGDCLYDYLDTNCLRVNKWGTPNTHAVALSKFYIGTKPKILSQLEKRLDNLNGIEPEVYHGMSYPNKKNYVRNVKHEVYGLLLFLSIQKPVS